jgi:Spy/CpxP family protein refolding chaperone
MKKSTIIAGIFCFLFANVITAQSTVKEEIDIIQGAFGAEKKEIMAKNLDLTGVDATSFWKIYDEYEVERKAIGKDRLNLLNTYTTATGKFTNDQADEMLKKSMSLRSSEDKLIGKYTNKIKKATNATVASQFYMIESYIETGIRFAIYDNIDFIQNK